MSKVKAKGRKRQALCIASVASNLDNFNRSNVDLLLKSGYEVTLAANFHTEEEINSQEKIYAFSKEMQDKGISLVHIDFARSMKKAGMHIKSFLQVHRLLQRNFDLIHCHSPICSAIVRAEAQKYRKAYGTKVIYTAHGFHFYSGAPLINWLLFYPIEKWMSRYTDVLITINREDYKRARRKFKAENTVYIPGVGVDLEKFHRGCGDAKRKREEFGITMEDFILLSVGELNGNKNHELAMRAIAKLKNEKEFARIHYLICGKGRLKEYLERLADELGLSGQVHLLGYREDIADILGCADVFLFTSKREGLPMALMEAMAAGLPCIVTKIRGNMDLIRDGIEGYVVNPEAEEIKKALQALFNGDYERMCRNVLTRIQKYDIRIVNQRMEVLYNENR